MVVIRSWTLYPPLIYVLRLRILIQITLIFVYFSTVNIFFKLSVRNLEANKNLETVFYTQYGIQCSNFLKKSIYAAFL